MSTLAKMKAAHMEAAETMWERTSVRIRNLLLSETAEVRKLTRLLLTVPDQVLYNVSGGVETGFDIVLNGYPWMGNSDGCARMECVAQFVGYDLLDDGEPGVGYFRSTFNDDEYDHRAFVVCGADGEGAQPYFHRNLSLLRETYPAAEPLTVARAIEILEVYVREREEREASIRRDFEENPNTIWDEDDVADGPTAEMEAWVQLVEELTVAEVPQGAEVPNGSSVNGVVVMPNTGFAA